VGLAGCGAQARRLFDDVLYLMEVVADCDQPLGARGWAHRGARFTADDEETGIGTATP
jgi:hypothetical protein